MGVTLTGTQLNILLLGAAHEKVTGATSAASISGRLYKSPFFEERYRSILDSVLLYGSARVSVPESLSASLDAFELVKTNLLDVRVSEDIPTSALDLTVSYENAADAFLEYSQTTTGAGHTPLDLDGMPVAMDPLEVAHSRALGSEVSKQVRPLWNSLSLFDDPTSAIMKSHVDDALAFNLLALSNSLGIRFESIYGELQDFTQRIPAILSAMGLGTISGERRRTEEPPIFLPSDLNEVFEHQRAYLGGDGSFEDHFTRESIWLRENPIAHLALQAYWAATFDVLQAVEASNALGMPLVASGMHNYSPETSPAQSVASTDETLTLYRIYLREAQERPSASTVAELVRLSDSTRIRKLREKLEQWGESPVAASNGAPDEMVRDIAAAMKSASRDAQITKVAKHLGWGIAAAGVVGAFASSPIVAIAGALGKAVPLGEMATSIQRRFRYGWYAT